MSSSTTDVQATTTSCFDFKATTLSCGETFVERDDMTLKQAAVPQSLTNDILDFIDEYCHLAFPEEVAIFNYDTTNDLPFEQTFDMDDGLKLTISNWEDERPECADYNIDPKLYNGDSGCKTLLYHITNTCDAKEGMNKGGGIVNNQCCVWAWEAEIFISSK